ncbi:MULTISPECIES: hypothetical protein [unclassified Sphingobacterium]|uniref:hypothetical protein n=1 Tax=unclassified Sphingobacterium TaxID=2609468 RepID=UPI0025CCDBA3|nr:MULTISPECIES: hypothetical protein [unclassified Sphingobacterium]
MTLDELTLELLAERALAPFDSKGLVNWAVCVLELGYESENLFILAGLDFENTEEREKYFLKSIADLKLDVVQPDDELIEKYAMTIAKRAITGKISIEYAFDQMVKIEMATEYDIKYRAFYEIDEDLDYLKYDNSTLFNAGLTIENSKEFILKEFEFFVKMESLKIPQEEQNKVYCEKCKKLTIPATKIKYQLRRPFKYKVWACGFCGYQNIKFSNDHKVKRLLIEEYERK